ncbi:hypothetical protein [Algoriphagus terrigena]|uniref:hypothetical protein n=1 Tax=Algoriphagus terrigena TaxID=344884 RepID=UPI00047DA066|nr:hypothetical protein [Algoriphagus terrigena]
MRQSPNAETLKYLYVLSGNVCAYPDCSHPIFNNDGLYIAQLCHIHAAEKGGQRYNHEQSDEERRSSDNLLFMCHRHHKETDPLTADALRSMKQDHESQFTEKGREATQNMIRQVLLEINSYWDQLSRKSFEFHDLKIERDFNKGVLGLLDELEEHFQSVMSYCDICAQSDSSQRLHEDLSTLLSKVGIKKDILEKVPYYENPFVNRNWELHNIGRPNFNSHFKLTLHQLRVKIIEELLKSDPKNGDLRDILNKFRDDFDENYTNSYYVD